MASAILDSFLELNLKILFLLFPTIIEIIYENFSLSYALIEKSCTFF